LERQIRRLKTSEYAEIRELASEIADACSAPPDCRWEQNGTAEALAPTLARHVDADEHLTRSRENLREWAAQNLPPAELRCSEAVDLMKPSDAPADIVATLLYPVSDRAYRELYQLATSWNAARRNEVLDVALESRTRRDDLLRNFRNPPYVYDIVMDIGAYRDLHRHRRCQQFRQEYSTKLGYETPEAIEGSGASELYSSLISQASNVVTQLPKPGSHYLLPLATRSRFLFKMDFAEAEYISRLRSGVKGHFSYRKIAWQMKEKMAALEPELARLLEATPPWVEDPLHR
jgi:thymidylate synthase ThyX